MTHTDTLATLGALRTALLNLEEPTPELAERTAAVLAGAHARHLASVADRHEAAAAQLYERIAEHLTDRPIAAAAYALAAQCAFLAADYRHAAALITAAENHAARHDGDVPPLARLLKLDHRVNTPTTS